MLRLSKAASGNSIMDSTKTKSLPLLSNAANITISIFLVFIGTITTISMSITEYLLLEYRYRGTYHSDTFESTYDMKYLPRNFITAPNTVIKRTGHLAIAAGAICGYLLYTKTHYSLTNTITVCFGVVTTIASFFTVVFVECVNYSSNRTWHYTNELSSGGRYTVEGWTCMMQRNLPMAGKDFFKTCWLSTVSRWLTIPLFVVSCFFLTMVVSRAVENRRAGGDYIKLGEEEDHRLDMSMIRDD
ncbi:hypothetical protein B0J14DRAFT_639768 [Halenospora varia]|nr:hypothetical protein B0J14DRAFT_639768 [Halenospora varia]